MTQHCQLALNLKISRVINGLWQIADMEREGRVLDQEVMSNALDAYVHSGFTTFDMADHYGSAEIITGNYRATRSDKSQVQLLTKWVPKPGKVSKVEVRHAIQRALDRMKSDALDLLQFHAWNYADPCWLDCLFWLQELKEEGLIRHIGMTNTDAIHLKMAIDSGIEIVSNQISYSLLDQRARTDMTAVCKELDVKILAFGVLAGGFLSNKWFNKKEPKNDELSTWSQMKYKRYIDVIGGWDLFQGLLNQLDSVAKKHRVSIAAVAARTILDQPGVGAVILGARLGESDHSIENLKIMNLSLDDDDKELIASAMGMFQPIPGNCGDEYRKPPYLTATGDLSHHVDDMPLPYEVTVDKNGDSKVFSGTKWEHLAGYCRALRKGDRILVSGTTATHESRLIGGADPASQTHFIIDKIQGVIESLGGRLSDVVRTRIFINDSNIWEPVARAHGIRFKDIQPSNTLVKAGLIGDGYLVEIEAEAIVSQSE